MRRTFNVISVIENDIDFDDLTLTQHWSKQRMMRYQKILRIIGPGNLIASFIVDTAHLKGDEIHNVFSNGIILIQNEHSRKIVTELIARPNQIKRYWKSLNIVMNDDVLNVLILAKEHQNKGYNKW